MGLTRFTPFALLFALVPGLALAVGPHAARVNATKDQIAAHVSSAVTGPLYGQTLTRADVRIQTRPNRAHANHPHTHIIGHDLRDVSWQVPALGVRGTAHADTLFGAGNATTVSGIKVRQAPVAPVLPPSAP